MAIVDETPPGQTIEVGGRRVPVSAYADQLLSQVNSTQVATRAQAIAQVKSGKALAAVVIPRDIVARIESGFRQGSLEVLYNGDALEQSLVQSELNSALAQANLGFSEEIQRAASQAIGQLLGGGNLGELGGPAHAVGLQQVPATLQAIIARQPPGAERASLERIQRLAAYAAQNLSLARNVLSTVGQPIQVNSRLIQGRRTPLSSFAVVVAVSVSLMFVCVLLAAGSVALEREEHVLARLARGLVSREALICEKLLLAGGCGLLPAIAMLAGIGAFVSLDWGRFGQWLLALVFAALAFAALGVAIGALARDVRAASLLAFLLSLPLAFLALVPSGAVAGGRVRRDRRDLVRVPVQGGTAGARRGRQRCRAVDRRVDRPSARPDSPVWRAGSRRIAAAGVTSTGYGLSADAHAQAARDRLAARAGARDRPAGRSPRAAAVCVTGGPGAARRRLGDPALPDLARLSISATVERAREAAEAGVGAVLLFGIPSHKDEEGSGAWDDAGVVQLAVARAQAGAA